MSSVAQSPVDLEARFVTALTQAASPDRFAVYTKAAGQDPEFAARLYIWDRNVAASIMRDLAIIEVALRNSLARQLVRAFGRRWYTDPFVKVDRRLEGARDRATSELARSGKPLTSDRLVAQLSLGFWVNLLDARGSERLWRSDLHRAFPGARAEAAASGARLQRSWVLSQLRVMRFLRNRCAHHEPTLTGVPLPGQAQRISSIDGIAAYTKIARMIDRDLADWLAGDTLAVQIIAARPGPVPKAKA
jgi:hypothetical protein